MQATLLVVDDEAFNLEFLTQCLESSGFAVITAVDGITALEQLQAHANIDAILLDRMMPRMDGMEVLRRMKENPRWRELPVIMQTAAAATRDIMEGIQAGAYYYLTKPYEHTMLLAIVQAAVEDAQRRNALREEVRQHQRAAGLMEQAQFHFRTLEEARNLASFLANCFPDPELAVQGLSELMVNAVEHGNLGITYAEKTRLVLAGAWQREVERRLGLQEYRHRNATVHLQTDAAAVRVRIADQGQGFDWRNYLDISPQRATVPHGRGIAIARIVSFSSIEYLGSGNEVVCTKAINHDN